MILFWGLKKFPLLLEIPTLKDHLTSSALWSRALKLRWSLVAGISRGSET
jgi:hypothetical protein